VLLFFINGGEVGVRHTTSNEVAGIFFQSRARGGALVEMVRKVVVGVFE